MSTGKIDIVLGEVREVRKETVDIGKKVAAIEQHLYDMNSKVQTHERQIGRLFNGIEDNKVRIAKYLGASFGGGGIVGAILLVVRCMI